MKSNWLSRFTFGEPPLEFIKQELAYTPKRMTSAIRLFLLLIWVTLLGVAIHVPSSLLGMSIAIILAFYPLFGNVVVSFKFALTIFWQLIFALFLGILSLSMFGGEPAFLLPWCFIVLMALFFYVHHYGYINVMPLIFFITAMNQPENPGLSVDQGLAEFALITFFGLFFPVLAHLYLWPRSPRDELTHALFEGLHYGEKTLETLLDAAPSSSPIVRVLPPNASIASWLKSLAQLSALEAEIRRHDNEWKLLISEFHNLLVIFNEIDKIRLRDDPKRYAKAEEIPLIECVLDRIQLFSKVLQGHLTPSSQWPKIVDLEDQVQALSGKDRIGHLLHRALDSSTRIHRLLFRIQQDAPITAEELPFSRTPTSKVLAHFWEPSFFLDHAEQFTWALKYSVATMLCFLLVQSLEWDSGMTAGVTVIMVAQGSLGASLSRSTMRLTGAILGGILGLMALMTFQPLMETIGGFLFMILPFYALTAWITSGSLRTYYMGAQLGFAFVHATVSWTGPILDLMLPFERVLAIILGILVAVFVETFWFPQRSQQMVLLRLGRMLKTYGTRLSQSRMDQIDLPFVLRLTEWLDQELGQLMGLMAFVVIEPGARRPHRLDQREVVELTLEIVQDLFKALHSRTRYHFYSRLRRVLSPAFDEIHALKRAQGYDLHQIGRFMRGDIKHLELTSQEPLNLLIHRMRTVIDEDGLPKEFKESLMSLIDLERKIQSSIRDLLLLVQSQAEVYYPTNKLMATTKVA